MASRESAYLPPIHNPLFVPVDPSDDLMFKQKVRTIKAVITELEDENNLIAYKIAKTRRRIDEKKAILAAQQAPVPEHRSFWGGRKSTGAAGSGAVDEKPVVELAKPARGGGAKRDRTKSKNKAQKELGPPTTIAPLNAEELAYLGNGRPPADYTPDPGYASTTTQDAPRHEDMEVDELDDY